MKNEEGFRVRPFKEIYDVLKLFASLNPSKEDLGNGEAVEHISRKKLENITNKQMQVSEITITIKIGFQNL